MLFFFFIAVGIVIHWNESAMGLHVFPIKNPSHLPRHPIPLGLPSAPGPSACLMHTTWAACSHCDELTSLRSHSVFRFIHAALWSGDVLFSAGSFAFCGQTVTSPSIHLLVDICVIFCSCCQKQASVEYLYTSPGEDIGFHTSLVNI